LPLDGIADGAGERRAFQLGLHQDVLSSLAQQSIRKAFVRFVTEHQDGNSGRASAHLHERMQQGRAIG
jgi:hypothetical protein